MEMSIQEMYAEPYEQREQQIKDLIRYLRKAAEEEGKKADKEEFGYTRGYGKGTASAYELCARWIEEIMRRA